MDVGRGPRSERSLKSEIVYAGVIKGWGPPLRFCGRVMTFGPRAGKICSGDHPTLAHEIRRGYNTEDANATSDCRVESR